MIAEPNTITDNSEAGDVQEENSEFYTPLFDEPTISLADEFYFNFSNGLWTGKKPPFQTINVVRNTNFATFGIIDLSNVAKIEVEQRQFIKRRLSFGDIIIERSGGGPKQPVGRVVFFDQKEGDYSFSNFTSLIRSKYQDVIDPKFLLYNLLNFYHFAGIERYQAQTTGLRNLDFNRYKEAVSIPLLSINEQRAIVRILSTVQAAIAKQDELIQTTQALKKVLMNKVFTDTDGWQVHRLGEIATVSSGGTPNRDIKEFWDNGTIPWVKTGEINYNLINDTDEKITDAGLKGSSAKMLPDGTLLMAMYGQGITRGRVAILGISASLNQACAAIIPKNDSDLLPKFLYYYFEYNYDYIRNFGHGANQKNLSGTIIKMFDIAYPTLAEEQQKIINSLTSIDQKINQHYTRKQTLGSLFRTLLHELMSGKRRVSL